VQDERVTDDDRPPNVAALAAQLDCTMDILFERIDGLTDEEYLWATGCLGRADYTIGSRSWTWDNLEGSPTAQGGLALRRSSYPWGLDPKLPLADILWWQNREMIHHGAEIAMLRDLYAHRAR
jgi:hypothetical protein